MDGGRALRRARGYYRRRDLARWWALRELPHHHERPPLSPPPSRALPALPNNSAPRRGLLKRGERATSHEQHSKPVARPTHSLRRDAYARRRSREDSSERRAAGSQTSQDSFELQARRFGDGELGAASSSRTSNRSTAAHRAAAADGRLRECSRLTGRERRVGRARPSSPRLAEYFAEQGTNTEGSRQK